LSLEDNVHTIALPTSAPQGLTKAERLTRKKIIEEVHAKGESIKTPAIVMVYHFTELPEKVPVQVVFTVSKRIFKRAHDRNRVKRLLREAYRKQKHHIYQPLVDQQKQVAIFFIFTGRQLPNYQYVHGKIFEVLKRFKSRLQEKPNENDAE
jgi:ribonuclease P protein component